MKIINVNKSNSEIQLYVKDVDGSDVMITIPHQHFIYTPTMERTTAVTMHGFKKNIFILDEPKPDYMDYFIPYNDVATTNDSLEQLRSSNELVIKTFEELPQEPLLAAPHDPYSNLQLEVDQQIIEYINSVSIVDPESKIESKPFLKPIIKNIPKKDLQSDSKLENVEPDKKEEIVLNLSDILNLDLTPKKAKNNGLSAMWEKKKSKDKLD